MDQAKSDNTPLKTSELHQVLKDSCINSTTNPYLQKIFELCSIISDSSKEAPPWVKNFSTNYLIAIPQKLSLDKETITLEDIENHIWKPSTQPFSIGGVENGKYGHYETLNGKKIRIIGNHILTWIGFDCKRSCRILMTEDLDLTAIEGISASSNSKRSCLTLLHINRPLAGGIMVPDDMSEMDPKTLHKYTAIMRSYPENEIVFIHIDNFLQQFSEQIKEVDTPYNEMKKKIYDIWQLAVYEIMNGDTFKTSEKESIKTSESEPNLLDRQLHTEQVEQAIESYILERGFPFVFKRVLDEVSSDDLLLWNVLFKYRHCSPQDLDIVPEFQCEQVQAVDCFRGLNDCKTPLDMMLCLKHCVQAIDTSVSNNLNRHGKNSSSYQLTTDDILDQLLYVIIQSYDFTSNTKTEQNVQVMKSSFPVVAYLKYIADFHFVNSSITSLGFTLANVQVAVEWFLQHSSFYSMNECLWIQNQKIQLNATDDNSNFLIQTDNEAVSNRTDEVKLELKCVPCSIVEASESICRIICKFITEGNISKPQLYTQQSISDSSVILFGHSYHLEDENCIETDETEVDDRTKSTSIKYTKKLWNDEIVYQVVCGQHSFALVTDQGSLYTWGNIERGRLGIRILDGQSKYVPLPNLVASLSQKTISQISLGSYHVLITDINGHVYAFGDNQYAQLAIPPSELSQNYTSSPTLIQELKGIYISSVACGRQHSLALSSEGSVYSWGCNCHGKLGRPSTTDLDICWKPGLVNINWSGKTISGERRYDPSIGIDKGKYPEEDGVVLRISCGEQHSFAVTRDGAVFSWGCGYKGRLGLGSHADTSIPLQILALSDPSIRVVQVSGGGAHSLFLLSNGLCFACGSNNSGQLGIPHKISGGKENENVVEDFCLLPRCIQSLSSVKILQISCGDSHSGAMDSSGCPYFWGCNINSQCGTFHRASIEDGLENKTTEEQILIRKPYRVHDVAIRHISCGAYHSLVIS